MSKPAVKSQSATVETRAFSPGEEESMLRFIATAIMAGGQFSGVREDGAWRVTSMTPPAPSEQPAPVTA